MIIGVDGYAGAGKDTVADVFVKVGFKKISFADALREAVVHCTELSLDTFLDRNIKDAPFKTPFCLSDNHLIRFCEYLGYSHKIDVALEGFEGLEVFTPRDLLIHLGTKVGREQLAESIWLDKYDEKRQGHKHVVTPDCRFSNEREHIKSIRGLVFWVHRDGIVAPNKHISENDKWDIDKYDVVVHNQNLRTLQSELGLWWSMKGWNIR